MTVCEILTYPQHKVELRRKSTPFQKFNRQGKRLIRDLIETLKAHPDGVGLAAPQINMYKRVVVVCLGIEEDGEWQAGLPEALVNPEIVEARDERKDFDGCLSFPGIYGETTRPHNLRVAGLDEEGKPFDQVYEGFDAVIVHHEIDHLDGMLFTDRIANWEDLYTIHENKVGELVRIPISVN